MNKRERAEINRLVNSYQERRKKTPSLTTCAYHFMNKINSKHSDLRLIFDPEVKYNFVPVDYVIGQKSFETILIIRRDNSSGYSKKSRYFVVIVAEGNTPTHEIVAGNIKTFNEANSIAIDQSMKERKPLNNGADT